MNTDAVVDEAEAAAAAQQLGNIDQNARNARTLPTPSGNDSIDLAREDCIGLRELASIFVGFCFTKSSVMAVFPVTTSAEQDLLSTTARKNFILGIVGTDESRYMDPFDFMTIYWTSDISGAVTEAFTQMHVLFPLPKPTFTELIRERETVLLLAEYAGCVFLQRLKARVGGMDHARRLAIRDQHLMISERIKQYVERRSSNRRGFSSFA